MFLWAIISICIPFIHGTGISITPLNASAGIFFEDIGRANLYANEWKLVMYYDLEIFKLEFSNIQYVTHQITELCSKLRNESELAHTCNGTLLQINLIVSNIKSQNILLNPQNREKRALFNAVGVAFKSLFGSLDEDDAKLYDEQIKNLTLNQNSLLSLMKSQTLIIEATANLFKKTKYEIDKELQLMQQKLKSIVIKTKILEHRMLTNNIIMQLESLISLITLMASRYQTTQTEIIDLLIDAHHGKFHPTLISPKKVEQLLLQIRQELPSSLILPINNKGNIITQIYRLSKISATIVNTKIILELKFPLPFQEIYQIFKPFPLPTIVNDTFVHIKPANDFILLDYKREHYLEMTFQELQNCATVDHKQFYCKNVSPIFNTNSGISQCEVDLLIKAPITSECQIIQSYQSSYWMQLTQQNAWLFSLKSPIEVDIVCDNTLTSETLQKTGTVYIHPGCYMKSKNFFLYGHDIKTANVNAHFIPSVNINDLIANIKTPQMNNKEEEEFDNEKTAENQDLEKILESINTQKSQEMTPLNPINNHHIHHYIMTYIILAIIFLIIGIYIFRKYNNKNKHSSVTTRRYELQDLPTPAPRIVNFKISPTPQFRNTENV